MYEKKEQKMKEKKIVDEKWQQFFFLMKLKTEIHLKLVNLTIWYIFYIVKNGDKKFYQ